MSPTYLHDFQCNVIDAHTKDITSPHQLHEVLNYEHLSNAYRNYILVVSIEYEPQYYHQEFKHDHWRDAMSEELSAMLDNETWIVVSFAIGKCAIDCRWIYKNKFNSDGALSQRKAHFIAKGKGYTQQDG